MAAWTIASASCRAALFSWHSAAAGERGGSLGLLAAQPPRPAQKPNTTAKLVSRIGMVPSMHPTCTPRAAGASALGPEAPLGITAANGANLRAKRSQSLRADAKHDGVSRVRNGLHATVGRRGSRSRRYARSWPPSRGSCPTRRSFCTAPVCTAHGSSTMKGNLTQVLASRSGIGSIASVVQSEPRHE